MSDSHVIRKTVFSSRHCQVLMVLAALGTPALAAAQDTRAGGIIAEQADKATRLAPRVPTTAERLIDTAQRILIEEPSGFYPYFGSVYSGGGFTLGAGYRQFTGDRANWNLAGLISMKSYKLIEGSVLLPGQLDGRLNVRARVGWRDATQVPYHGLGIESPADNPSAFRMKLGWIGGDVTAKPHRYAVLQAGVTYEDFSLQDPSGTRRSVEDVHTPVSAPGVGVDPTYLHTSLSAGFDWRPAADYARRGGLYSVALQHYGDRDDIYSFSRFDADVVQHFPILRENWVVSLRGALQTTSDSDQVPYFLLPSLGSGNTLRGYSSWRFRDRHSVLTSAEFRWIASRLALDMAIFYDAGMVASEFDRLAINGLKSDYGFGMRFHGPISTPLRIELARGDEGTRLVFAASAAF